MAIKVSCPSCGAKRTLPDVYRDRNTTCPKCGTQFSASSDSSSSIESMSILTGVRAVVEPAPEIDDPSGILFGTRTQAAPPFSVGEPSTMIANVSTDTERLRLEQGTQSPPVRPPLDPSAAPVRREYKVLTRQNLWFTGHFDPVAFQEALNTFASQGWTLKSTMILTVPGPDGPREEVVVILER